MPKSLNDMLADLKVELQNARDELQKAREELDQAKKHINKIQEALWGKDQDAVKSHKGERDANIT